MAHRASKPAHVHGPGCDHAHSDGRAGGHADGHAHGPLQEPMVRTEPKIQRNDPCPCGSGKKYKKCHDPNG